MGDLPPDALTCNSLLSTPLNTHFLNKKFFTLKPKSPLSKTLVKRLFVETTVTFNFYVILIYLATMFDVQLKHHLVSKILMIALFFEKKKLKKKIINQKIQFNNICILLKSTE